MASLTGLLTGFNAQDRIARADDQFKLSERKLRGAELMDKFKEARRVAGEDELEEAQTIEKLMVPGLTDQTKNALLENYKRSRASRESYLNTIATDPDTQDEITKRFGDITQLLKPSKIQAGTLPSAAVDLKSIRDEARKIRTQVEETPDDRKAEVIKYGQGELKALGAPDDIIETFLPSLGKVLGTKAGTGRTSALMPVAEPQNLPEFIRTGGGGQQTDITSGVTTKYTKEGDKFMKQYVKPDELLRVSYPATTEKGLKLEKAQGEIDRIKATTNKLNVDANAIPVRLQQKWAEVKQKVKDSEWQRQYKQASLGIQQASVNARLYATNVASADRGRSLGVRAATTLMNIGSREKAKAVSALASADKAIADLVIKTGNLKDAKKLNEYAAAVQNLNDLRQQRDQLAGTIGNFENPMVVGRLLNEIGLGDIDVSGSFGGGAGMGAMNQQALLNAMMARGMGGGGQAPSPNINIVVPGGGGGGMVAPQGGGGAVPQQGGTGYTGAGLSLQGGALTIPVGANALRVPGKDISKKGTAVAEYLRK
jgi:hypothetical protein